MGTHSSNGHNSRRDFIRHSVMVTAGAMLLPQQVQATTPESFSSLPDARWPGRVVVSGKTLDDFVAIAEEASADASWKIRVFQSVSEPTLQIRAQWRSIGAVTEWIPTLVNNSSQPSKRVSEVRSLAIAWRTRGAVDFYGNAGARTRLNDFVDRIERDIGVIELMPTGGRSSEGVLPFFALTDQHDALAVGIGWSGRWLATLRHSSGQLQVEVGLPKVGFVLRPQESVRLPSVLLARVPDATADHARRAVRAHLARHVVPRDPDGKSPNFTANSPLYEYLIEKSVVNEETEMQALESAAALGFETYWVDACWFGNSTQWDQEVGNWNVRRNDFPRGLRPLRAFPCKL